MNPNLEFPFRRKPTQRTLSAARNSVLPLVKAVRTARARAGRNSMVVAWVSDIHLHAWRGYAAPLEFYATDVDCSAQLKIALAEICAIEPDLLVFGGDIADSGCDGEAPADEYDEMKRVLDECLPASVATLPILGNHDHADKPLSSAWRSVFARTKRTDWPDPVDCDDFYYEVRRGGWRFIALDSRQGQPLSERQHTWLCRQLERDPAAPAVVLVHRPFVSVGNWVDHCRIEDRRSFNAIDRAGSVKLVLSGHTHKAAAWTYRSKTHVVFPACAFGIPDPCGWGAVVLGENDIHAIFVKDLGMKTFDWVTSRWRRSHGHRRLRPLPFEQSPLLDPCTLPRGRNSGQQPAN